MANFDVNYLFGLLSLIISTITIVGHLLIGSAFYQVRSLTTNPSNLLILAHSISDLIFGLFVFINYGIPITCGLDYPYGEIGCLLSYLFDITSYINGNLLLVAFALDRVQLVSMDYSKYVKLQTKSKIKWIIFVCCAIGLMNALFEVGFWNYAKRNNEAAANIDFDQYCAYPPRRMRWFSVYTFGIYCTPVILVSILSVVFLFLLRRRIRKSARIGNSDSSTRRTGEDEESDVIRNRYLKPAMTLGALVAAMTFSLLPYCIYLTNESFSKKTINYNLLYMMWLIYQLNPLLDAVFYAATQKSIKAYYWKKIRRFTVG